MNNNWTRSVSIFTLRSLQATENKKPNQANKGNEIKEKKPSVSVGVMKSSESNVIPVTSITPVANNKMNKTRDDIQNSALDALPENNTYLFNKSLKEVGIVVL